MKADSSTAWPFASQILVSASSQTRFDKKVMKLMKDGYRLVPGSIQRVAENGNQFSPVWWYCTMDVPTWKQL
jgi:hypothetical protein